MDDWLYRISPCLRIVGDAAIPPGWVEAMRYIYEHELVLFKDADFVVEINAEKFECPSGSYIIVPPGQRHISRAVGKRGGHRYWVHFDWDYVGESSHLPVMTYCPARPREDLFRLAPDFIPDRICHGEIRKQRVIMELFHRIDNRFNRGDEAERMSGRALFLELLLELLGKENEPRKPTDTLQHMASKIRRRLNAISDMPKEKSPSIREYLEASGVSYAHQCRMFKQAYGIAPWQYVNELRMTRIRDLLRDTDLPIAEIADLSGFECIGHFSRAFKKSTGFSPRSYRNNDTLPS